MAQKYDIFISYRRDGGAQYARIMQLMLSQRGYRVFLDYDELIEGNFGEHIKEAVKEAPIFMIMLSKGALNRCKNDGDWVRREIELAISEGKQIIPINPDKTFEGIPDDIPEIIKDKIGNEPHSDISFGQTLGATVDFMMEKRIVPKIGKRLRQDSDINVLNQKLLEEDNARRRHRRMIKGLVASGVIACVIIAGFFGQKILHNNEMTQKRKNLIEQMEKRHQELNLMANDSISIEQLEVLDNIFNNLRDVYKDSIKFSAFEVSEKEYHTIMGERYDEKKACLPMTNVSFKNAMNFIIKLNEMINSEEGNWQFHLPTKEEWEYAASDGNMENPSQYAGSNDIDKVAWYKENTINEEPHPSDGQNELQANKFGLFDMSGNVAEHVFTPYFDFNNPESTQNMMLVKGGSFASEAKDCTIASEYPLETDLSSPKVGFRLVLRKK